MPKTSGFGTALPRVLKTFFHPLAGQGPLFRESVQLHEWIQHLFGDGRKLGFWKSGFLISVPAEEIGFKWSDDGSSIVTMKLALQRGWKTASGDSLRAGGRFHGSLGLLHRSVS